MAQSISAYEHHLPTLAQSRHVCIFQATGLGPINDDDQSTLLKDVSLPKQAERVAACLDEHLNHDDIVDLAGFSMGGRIALAMACLYPNRIRKIHLTGVAYQPSNHALVHYTAWKELLRRDNMEGFAWSALLGTYEPSFLSDQPERLARMIKFVSETHTSRGLLALLEQTHNEEWSVASMVDRLLQQQTATSSPNIHLCVGDQDRMATISDVLQLSGTLYNDFAPFRLYSLGEEDFKDAHVTIVKGCGHAVPMEAPAAWRRDVLNFLDKDE